MEGSYAACTEKNQVFGKVIYMDSRLTSYIEGSGMVNQYSEPCMSRCT